MLFIALICLSLSSPTHPSQYTFVQKGNIPILLTAPHGGFVNVPHINERTQGTKTQDLYTFDLVQEISCQLNKLGYKPYIVAAHFHRRCVDANQPSSRAYEDNTAKPLYDFYHQQIGVCVQEMRARYPGQHPLLIDVHGHGRPEKTIFIGTRNKKTVQKLIAHHLAAWNGPRSVLGALVEQGCTLFPPVNEDIEEHTAYNGGFTVNAYGSHRKDGIDALQLEFAREDRLPENREITAKKVARALAIFHERWQQCCLNCRHFVDS